MQYKLNIDYKCLPLKISSSISDRNLKIEPLFVSWDNNALSYVLEENLLFHQLFVSYDQVNNLLDILGSSGIRCLAYQWEASEKGII